MTALPSPAHVAGEAELSQVGLWPDDERLIAVGGDQQRAAAAAKAMDDVQDQNGVALLEHDFVPPLLGPAPLLDVEQRAAVALGFLRPLDRGLPVALLRGAVVLSPLPVQRVAALANLGGRGVAAGAALAPRFTRGGRATPCSSSHSRSPSSNGSMR